MFPSGVEMKADSGTALLAQLKASASARNGNEGPLPRLRNDEVLQMADYFRRVGVPGWDKLARIGLGFFQEGDKFQAGTAFSMEHTRALVPASILPSAWIRAGTLAQGLPSSPQAFKPADMSSEANARRVTDSLASGAFKLLQAERGRTQANPFKPPPVRELPKLPPPLDKIPDVVIPKKGGGGGMVLLLIVAVLALSSKKGR